MELVIDEATLISIMLMLAATANIFLYLVWKELRKERG